MLFFYVYGIYLHWGFEADALPADHPIMNTSFQHYAHHAISIKNRPYHTGFYFKVRASSPGCTPPRAKTAATPLVVDGRGRGMVNCEAPRHLDFSCVLVCFSCLKAAS